MITGRTLLQRIVNDLSGTRHRAMTEATHGRLLGLWKSARGLIEPISAREKSIRDSPRWNKYEKAEKLGALVPVVSRVQAEIGKDYERVTHQLTALNKTLGTVPPKYTEPLLRQAKGAEFRQTVRPLTHIERTRLFSEAIEANNTDVIDAITQSPDPLLPAEVIARGLDAWGKKYLPAEYIEREQAQLLTEHLSSLVSQLNAWERALQQPE